MYSTVRIRAHRAVVMVAVAGLLATGAVVTIATSSAGGPAPAAPVDHFLCYNAAQVTGAGIPKFVKPAAVALYDQFYPNGYLASVGALNEFCNPVEKTHGAVIISIGHPEGHLTCWAITPNALPSAPPRVIMTNQFGQGRLQLSPPNALCLPSWKRFDPAAFPPPDAPPDADHYVCYPAKYPTATSTPRFTKPSVGLKDQFVSITRTVQAPNRVCLPVRKQLAPGGATSPVFHPDVHLTCFAVATQTVAARPFVKNQFRIGQVSVKSVKRLCVPSTKDIVGP